MSIESKYDPAKVEDKWYDYWIEHKIFKSEPDEREPYTIVIPPPNVTGVLHMGHILNNTIQDILIRRARLLGKNACWVPGTDHASIATEAKVVNLLAQDGIVKTDVGREKFLEHAWDWKEKHDGIIFHQLKKLGASCDWDRAAFTLDESLSKSVIKSFIDLYNEGKVYRGARMINWDPKAKTALSDEEVTRKEVNSQLFYVKYKIKGSDEFVSIATTRPETILGDTGICVHPEDERYKHLKGKMAIVPMVNREVPIVFDTYIDMEFGTGALKVTPAHDINDYELGLKNNLEVIDTLNEDGSMSEAAGHYIGEDRFVVRKKIVKDLNDMGLLIKTEDIVNNVGYSERNPDTVIEPRISTQWFLKMDELVKPALSAVKESEIKIHPGKFVKVYTNWLENIKDWCISRQLWWGHRIPAWYNDKGQFVVAVTKEEALVKFKEAGFEVNEKTMRQDEDVLDTWFSSWLWPFSVFNSNDDDKDLNYYYPTNDLVTGHDIIFFWVARMIIAGYHFTGKKPFSNVYFTGMVRDKQGRKMSKSLGNSPEALKLIEEFGADGVRVGMMLAAPAGNDLPFDDSLCLQGRNFANKIWNAFRLVSGWETDDRPLSETELMANEWFESRINESLVELEKMFLEFRISDALMLIYKLVWDDFCSWYLEMIKPAYGDKIGAQNRKIAFDFFEKLLIVLHPFMPFITEEIWQNSPSKEGISISQKLWPTIGQIDRKVLKDFANNMQLVSAVRQIRNDLSIGFKESLMLKVPKKGSWEVKESLLEKLANVSSVEFTTDKISSGKSLIIAQSEFIIPIESGVNVSEEKDRISKEIKYTKGFMKSVEGKLKNEKFVSNAPEKVIELEKKKFSDANEKLILLENQLKSL